MAGTRVMRAHQAQCPVGFLGDGRYDQGSSQTDHQRSGNDNRNDRQDTAFQFELVLEKLYERLHHIGQQPGDQERKQRIP